MRCRPAPSLSFPDVEGRWKRADELIAEMDLHTYRVAVPEEPTQPAASDESDGLDAASRIWRRWQLR